MPLSISTLGTYSHRQHCCISLPCHTFFKKPFPWYIFVIVFSVTWIAIYGVFTTVTWVPREGCVGAGYRAFPSAGFPLPCAWKWVLDHVLPVISVFAFLSAFLHPIAGWFEFPHCILLAGILPSSSSFPMFFSLPILAKVACPSSSSCDPPGTSAPFWVHTAPCVTTLHTKLPVQDSCEHTKSPSKLSLGQQSGQGDTVWWLWWQVPKQGAQVAVVIQQWFAALHRSSSHKENQKSWFASMACQTSWQR